MPNGVDIYQKIADKLAQTRNIAKLLVTCYIYNMHPVNAAIKLQCPLDTVLKGYQTLKEYGDSL